MASANLDLVRSIYAAWERGDFSRADWAQPEVESVYVGGPSPGTFRGLAGMAEGHGGWLNAWADFRVIANEYRELDGERVLVLTHASGQGERGWRSRPQGVPTRSPSPPDAEGGHGELLHRDRLACLGASNVAAVAALVG
jgi:hypothetical protein